jgi:superfamily II DNA or RNA helicase
MSLTGKFRSLIDSAVRSRGNSYYHGGAVRIMEGDERFVRAFVRGTDKYTVLLSIKGENFSVSCTCPYYEDRDICKHIWATMLAAEASGYLDGSGGEPSRLLLADARSSEDGDDDDYEEDDYEEEEDDYEYDLRERRKTAAGIQSSRPYPQQKAPAATAWEQQLRRLSHAMTGTAKRRERPWPSSRELLYVVDAAATMEGRGIIVELAYRELKLNGEWSKIKTQAMTDIQPSKLPDPDDRRIISLMIGAEDDYHGYSSGYDYVPSRYKLIPPIEQVLMPMMCGTGRCLLRLSQGEGEMPSLRWDDRGPWELWLEIRRGAASNQWVITGSLRRADERLDISKPELIVSGGLVFNEATVARLEDFGAFAWISELLRRGAIYVPLADRDEMLKAILSLPHLPKLDLAQELRFEEVSLAPQPCLKIRESERRYWGDDLLDGELNFDYQGEQVSIDDQARGIFDADKRRFILRDRAAEQRAAERLKQVGFKQSYSYTDSGTRLSLSPKNLPRVVRTLVKEGWRVEAEGKLYRQPGEFRIEVTSGIDWFDLHGEIDFGSTSASLPQLLAALKRGDNAVLLGDGTFGLLPEDWLKKYGLLAGLGSAEGDSIRFTRSQVGLLDAMLASQPQASFDAAFTRARDELQRFEGIKAADPPRGFVGELRGYQREGLGWLYFLQQFGFGGCLADDMGLGKTIMALALLESRRERRRAAYGTGRETNGKAKRKNAQAAGNDSRPCAQPSLVVVPKSLVFNWKQEAARFAPGLRLLDHTGATRAKGCDHFKDYDLIITTYGTLRRDALQFKEAEFDYVILDEAQAIKNADTASAKAARLVRGRNRLALSGTPIENHLGELWSLFDFLNPGLLGGASVFKLTGPSARNPDEQTRELLAAALRPFILRRTKDQVARDLPRKVEQTIYCEMDTVQRRLYDELRDHYRRSLLGLIDEKGLKRSKIQILEALLRLRQAACHPGLVDKKRVAEPSAKLDVLLAQLAQVMDEGHKALVFSQFTSLLAIIRDRLDKAGVTYEYLDGRTRDRARRVERFQTDQDCKLFLVSLKAGGLGLNLTAAEYVFLLDPWWNPAVEAQAIDRAHRIGQTRQVFAYRLIAHDTVEEKVLELQQTKRELADAIINADNSLIRRLAREDLELLLS